MHSGVALIDPQEIFKTVALTPGMRVADLGCGRTGHVVFPAAKVVGETGVVYAVDILKDVLQGLNGLVRAGGHENIHPVWADVENYGKVPIPAASLNVCFMINVAFMLKDRLSAFKESARLLGAGGFLVVVDWKKKIGPLGPPAERQVRPEMLDDLARAAGLTPVKNFSLGDYHFCSLFKKS